MYKFYIVNIMGAPQFSSTSLNLISGVGIIKFV